MRMHLMAAGLALTGAAATGVATWEALSGSFDLYLWSNGLMFTVMAGFLAREERRLQTGQVCGSCLAVGAPTFGFCMRCGAFPRTPASRNEPGPQPNRGGTGKDA